MCGFLLTFFLFISPPLYGKEVLTVYSPSSFTSPYGSGLYLKEAFEKQCDCEIKYVGLDTTTLVINRLRLEGTKTKADVIVHLEDLVVDTSDFAHPLIPYGSSCLAFVYDSQKIPIPPKTLDDLIGSSYPIILQDPRTSITGFGFLLWMKKLYGNQAAQKWKALASHTLTFTKGWGEAYSLFIKGEAPIVLSYLNSPLYHELIEGKTHIKAMSFPEGHLCTSICAAKIITTLHPDLADKFIAFLLSKEGQHLIAIHGLTHPVGEIPEKWLKAQTFLKQPQEIPYTSQEISASRKLWIQEWIEGLLQ